MNLAYSADAPAKARGGRIAGVDVVRVAALLAVIFIHAPRVSEIGWTVEALARFAVPFFFLASGYFLGRSRRRTGEAITRSLARVGLPFLFWLAAYNAPQLIAAGELPEPWEIRNLISGGLGFHLWFLPALVVATALFAPLRPRPRLAAILGLGVTTGAAVLGPYAEARGAPALPHDLYRLAATLGFAGVGLAIGRLQWKPSGNLILALVTAGVLLAPIEAGALGYRTLTDRDVLFSHLPLSVGVFLVALRLPAFPGSQTIAALGRSSLGVYCVHVLVLQMLLHAAQPTEIEDVFKIGLLTFILAATLVMAMVRAPFLKRVLA